MAKTIATAILDHLQSDTTTLALCWKITKTNGQIIYGTDHDLDIIVSSGALAGTYIAGANITGSDVQSSDDMSVDNLEVNGAFSDSIAIPDLTDDDIEAGLLNSASVALFFVNWVRPNDGQVYLRTGTLGDLTWDTNSTYKTELRGLSQLLSQTIVQTYSVDCNVVKFGDSRCKIDVDAVSITAIVTSVVTRREFTVSGITTQRVGLFNTGVLIGIGGRNDTYTRQIKLDTTDMVQGKITLYSPYPQDVQIGDRFTMRPGCNRSYDACLNDWDNLDNFRGYGLYVPGIDAILKGTAGGGQPTVVTSGGGPTGFARPGV